MSLHELILKLLEGIREASIRADVAAVVSMFRDLYAAGRITDNKLLKGLEELCLDVLIEKNPLKSIEELREDASKCASEFYRAIRIETIRARVFSSVAPGE